MPVELCPHDTALFDGNCYWSNKQEMSPQSATTECAARGGILAAFPSEEAIEFIGTIWLVSRVVYIIDLNVKLYNNYYSLY